MTDGDPMRHELGDIWQEGDGGTLPLAAARAALSALEGAKP